MALSDMGLLERWIAARDAEAFNELVTRYSALVYGACRRVLGNEADAEDVAQDCFLTLARSAAAPRHSISGWLHKLATHRALDRRKAELRRRRREQLFAERKTAEAEPAWNQVQEYVDEAILTLPEKIRGVIVAHFL